MRTSRGNVRWISSSLALTRSATTREFSPTSIIATPMTISPFPPSVAKPCLTVGANRTWAMLRIRIGVPVEEDPTTTFSMSVRLVISASPRTRDCCSLRSMYAPPAFALFFSIASMTRFSGM
jgi:hypothetical protein